MKLRPVLSPPLAPGAGPPDGRTPLLGLALSGGGYRAAGFHLGTLQALDELGLLDQVGVLSTVSGGSIVGAAWLDFRGRNPGKPFQSFRDWFKDFLTSTSIDVTVVLEGAVDPFHKDTDYLVGAYREHLFKDRTLGTLPDYPLLCINATCLNTGKDWKFYRDVMGDWWFCRNPPDKPWKERFYPSSNLPIAVAVAASSCFPPVFAPLILKSRDYFPDQAKTVPYIALTDGGMYDNQGLNSLFANRCTHIVASDGSKPFDVEPEPGETQLVYLKRSSDIMMEKLRAMEFSHALTLGKTSGVFTALFSLDSKLPSESVEEINRCNIPTRLEKLSREELDALIAHARKLTLDRVPHYLCDEGASPSPLTKLATNEAKTLEAVTPGT
jgi:NTE family protein